MAAGLTLSPWLPQEVKRRSMTCGSTTALWTSGSRLSLWWPVAGDTRWPSTGGKCTHWGDSTASRDWPASRATTPFTIAGARYTSKSVQSCGTFVGRSTKMVSKSSSCYFDFFFTASVTASEMLIFILFFWNCDKFGTSQSHDTPDVGHVCDIG